METNFLKYNKTNDILIKCDNNYIGDLVIPEGVTKIANNAFEDCSGLISIRFPETLTEIGDGAFANCTGLTSIVLPNSVTSVGNFAFGRCTGLTSVVLSKKMDYIEGQTFYECTGLTRIEIPEGVSSIGYWAFCGCTGLKNIIIPESLANIECPWPFKDCSALPIENNIRYAGSILLEAVNKDLEEYTIKEGTRFIGDKAFKNCHNLKTIVLPSSVAVIGDEAFKDCDALVSIDMPSNISEKGAEAFKGCTKLPVENNIRYAGCYLVEAVNKEMESYTIKEGTRIIGTEAFKDCKNLKTIKIPNSVTEISDAAFDGCI